MPDVPRTCRTEGAAKWTYRQWVSRTPRQQVHLRIFRQLHSARRIGTYLRFRLGCSTLPVVMGRRDHTPRHRWHCQQCATPRLPPLLSACKPNVQFTEYR